MGIFPWIVRFLIIKEFGEGRSLGTSRSHALQKIKILRGGLYDL
jgi:hypothetical protein